MRKPVGRGRRHGLPGPGGRSGASTFATIWCQISRYPSFVAQRSTSARFDALTGDSQYSRDVPQMSIATAFGEIPEFAEDHVFWGCNHQIAIREESDRSPSAHLSAAPLVVAREDEVDLVARTWMDHVELEGCPDRVSNRGFTQVKLVIGKGSHQLVDVLHLKRSNDVDVLCEARLAVGDAGESTPQRCTGLSCVPALQPRDARYRAAPSPNNLRKYSRCRCSLVKSG